MKRAWPEPSIDVGWREGVPFVVPGSFNCAIDRYGRRDHNAGSHRPGAGMQATIRNAAPTDRRAAMSPEAVTAAAGAGAIIAFLWSVRREVADLRERMSRLEGTVDLLTHFLIDREHAKKGAAR